MKEKFNNKLSILFTLTIILYPILGAYASPISTLSVGDIVEIVLIPFMIMVYIKNKVKIKELINIPFSILAIYTVLQILISMLILNNEFSYYLSAVRMLFYYIILAMFTKYFFDKNKALKIYRFTALFAAIFCIIQVVSLKLFGIFIQGTIPGLPLRTEYLTNYNINMVNGGINASYNRPRSIFTEPSHFAIYVSLYLAIILLNNSEKKRRDILITTVSLLLSGSGTAIILCAIIYVIYFFKNLKKMSKKFIIAIIICSLAGVIMAPIYVKTESFQVFYSRTFVKGDSVEGRFGNYNIVFNGDKTLKEMLFGNGIVKTDEYMTSIPAIYYYFGIIGILYYSIIILYCFKKLKGNALIAWTILFLLAFEAEILFHARLLIFVAFIIGNDKREEFSYGENK